MEITSRQWRALAQAYPFFYPTANASSSDSNQEASARRAEFAQLVVPRTCRAFVEEVSACKAALRVSDKLSSAAAEPDNAAAVVTLLSHFFGCPPCFDQTSPPAGKATAVASLSPLSPRELHLLALYHRKQEQYEYVVGVQRQLLEASQHAARVLQSAILQSGASGIAEAGEGNTSLHQSTRESLLWLGGGGEGGSALSLPTEGLVNGSATKPSTAAFTSALASIPYTAPAPMGNTLAGQTPAPLAAHLPTLLVVNRCAGCGQVDGDLMVCTQCGEIRHEACGGPHPPEPSRVDGRMPTINVCRKCAKELNLSSSSSSLRSSTSSSERAELDEYFDSEEDTESSLSGFVVHSSEEEEEDEEGNGDGDAGSAHDRESGSSSNAEGDSDARSSDGSADEAPTKKHAARNGRDKHLTRSPPTRAGRDEKAKEKAAVSAKEKHQHAKRQQKRRRSDSSASSSDSESNGYSTEEDAVFSAPHRLPAKKKKATASSFSKKATVTNRPRGDAVPLSTQEKRTLQEDEDELQMLGITNATASAKHGNAQTTTTTTSNGAKKRQSDGLRSGTTQPSASSTEASPAPSQNALRPRSSVSGARRSAVNVASSSSSTDSD